MPWWCVRVSAYAARPASITSTLAPFKSCASSWSRKCRALRASSVQSMRCERSAQGMWRRSDGAAVEALAK
ncbi:hypothetical protein T492DRAFT_960500 [Pavlovales sp. CCMP2436]|nr:hypothetical protein T492DRAFT_960500 [Pavlovales sp. CCMP2436]